MSSIKDGEHFTMPNPDNRMNTGNVPIICQLHMIGACFTRVAALPGADGPKKILDFVRSKITIDPAKTEL